MICPHCKKEIPDASAFCPECGKKLEAAGQPSEQKQPKAPFKLSKKQLTIAVGVLAVLLIVFAASKLIKPSINLNDYISVSFTGYNTIGEAELTFDTEKFQDKYKGKLPSDFSDEYISCQLDKSDDLSNGDTVVLSWDCDDERALSRYGYKLKYEETPFSVEGLTEIDTFDPFEGISVAFDGISTQGTAVLSGEPTSIAAQDLDYSLIFLGESLESLSNGDTVTVYATYRNSDPTRHCIETYGLMPTTVAKDYTVEGLGEYITSLSEISEDGLAEMQTQAMDVLNAYAAKSWDEEEEILQDASYVGAYLLTAKDEDSYEKNRLYLVYNVKIEHFYEYYDTSYHNVDEMYWYIEYTDLAVNADGTVTVDITSYDTPSDRVEFYPDPDRDYQYWWYSGYASLDDLFEGVVTANLAEYNYEDGITVE